MSVIFSLAKLTKLTHFTTGTIKFVSDPTVKPGSTCIVRMPLVKCGEKNAVGPAKLTAIEDSLKILIVDDVKMNRNMLRKRLTRFVNPSAVITEAFTGEEAIKVVTGKETHWDIIIMDQYMEEAGGVLIGTETVNIMREMGVTSIIVGCSGNDMKDEFLAAGCQLCWGKPMTANQFILAQLKDELLKASL